MRYTRKTSTEGNEFRDRWRNRQGARQKPLLRKVLERVRTATWNERPVTRIKRNKGNKCDAEKKDGYLMHAEENVRKLLTSEDMDLRYTTVEQYMDLASSRERKLQGRVHKSIKSEIQNDIHEYCEEGSVSERREP